jgi:hypothetical protein
MNILRHAVPAILALLLPLSASAQVLPSEARGAQPTDTARPRSNATSVSRPDVGLVVAGGVVLGLSTLPVTAFGIAGSSNPEFLLLTIPVVGPIVEGVRFTRSTDDQGFAGVLGTALFVDAGIQALGLGLLLGGALHRAPVSHSAPSVASWVVLPEVRPTYVGASLALLNF